MARLAQPLHINEETLQELKVMSRGSKTDHRYVMRSRIILLLHQGRSYHEVQKELSVGREAVAK